MLTTSVDRLACGGITDLDPAELLVVELDGADWSASDLISRALADWPGVKVGVAAAPIPGPGSAFLETLTVTLAPGSPGRFHAGTAADLDLVIDAVERFPLAAAVLATTLTVTPGCSVDDGLVVESLAYSMLLGGPEFRAWRSEHPPRTPDVPVDPVLLDRRGNTLEVELSRPERHNALDRTLRDGLVEAFGLASSDRTIEEVRLSGRGPSFCSGGDLDEFGSAPDIVTAHLLRTNRSVARSAHRIADRLTVHLHGACIGAGVEVPAFAGRVEATDDTWFMLPEVRMGLIPGAGGTVSLTRRIGRWRTAYLALTGKRIGIDTALAWGLVDARV